MPYGLQTALFDHIDGLEDGGGQHKIKDKIHHFQQHHHHSLIMYFLDNTMAP